MSIIRRLLSRRADRPSVRGPLIVVNVNFFGADAARWFLGFLRRRRIGPPREPPRPRSMQSSFVGGGRSRALAELDSRIEPVQSARFDHSAEVIEEAAPDPAPPVRIYLGRPRRP